MKYSIENMLNPKPQAPAQPDAMQYIPESVELTPNEVAEAQGIYQQLKSPKPQQPAPMPYKGWGKI